MATRVEVHKSVLNLIKDAYRENKSDKGSKQNAFCGFLVGQASEEKISVVACARCPSTDVESVRKTAGQLTDWLAGGLVVCGIMYAAQSEDSQDSVRRDALKYKTLLAYSETDTAVVCHLNGVERDSTVASFYLHSEDSVVRAPVEILDTNLLQTCLIARARCRLKLTFPTASRGDWRAVLHDTVERLCEGVQSDSTVYQPGDNPILLGTGGCSGMSEQTTCRDLYSQLQEESSGRRKKQDRTMCGLTFSMLTDVSSESSQPHVPRCAPVIEYNTEKERRVKMVLPVDAVAVVPLEKSVTDLAASLSLAVASQLQAMETSITQHSKGDVFHTPEPYHYQPMGLQALFTFLQPRGLSEDQLEDHRKVAHRCLCLPMDRPLLRRANQFRLPQELAAGGYLVNVHEGLPPSKVQGGTQYLVAGYYSYHHYMQDRFDDNKWGCAYRSLQTLISWFNLQGYTSVKIPTHGEIQQALVDVGDKDPKFVGSRKWIGSMEVSFCLDQLIGVTSKILSVSNGAELSSKGRELAQHFSTQGTPIMIGGGVLAHTILGVDYDDVSGDINFLILDPHYTGAEDIKVIQDKGWCGWKGPEFWDKYAHYNMCMPQRPNVI